MNEYIESKLNELKKLEANRWKWDYHTWSKSKKSRNTQKINKIHRELLDIGFWDEIY